MLEAAVNQTEILKKTVRETLAVTRGSPSPYTRASTFAWFNLHKSLPRVICDPYISDMETRWSSCLLRQGISPYPLSRASSCSSPQSPAWFPETRLYTYSVLCQAESNASKGCVITRAVVPCIPWDSDGLLAHSTHDTLIVDSPGIIDLRNDVGFLDVIPLPLTWLPNQWCHIPPGKDCTHSLSQTQQPEQSCCNPWLPWFDFENVRCNCGHPHTAFSQSPQTHRCRWSFKAFATTLPVTHRKQH